MTAVIFLSLSFSEIPLTKLYNLQDSADPPKVQHNLQAVFCSLEGDRLIRLINTKKKKTDVRHPQPPFGGHQRSMLCTLKTDKYDRTYFLLPIFPLYSTDMTMSLLDDFDTVIAMSVTQNGLL